MTKIAGGKIPTEVWDGVYLHNTYAVPYYIETKYHPNIVYYDLYFKDTDGIVLCCERDHLASINEFESEFTKRM